jgi:hypothetical protein
MNCDFLMFLNLWADMICATITGSMLFCIARFFLFLLETLFPAKDTKTLD